MSSVQLDVTVVVVGYNDRESLPTCVGALAADPAAARIVVVDNASSDGTSEIFDSLRALDPRVETIENPENVGYAAAVDGVLPSITTAYLAVLNADSVPSTGWLGPQVTYLDTHPQFAATSPTVTLAGTERLNAAGLDIHVTGLGFNRRLHSPVDAAEVKPTEIPGLQGGAFVVRRDALEAAGGWYSGGFLYHEDVELSWTLRLMGYRIAFVPTPRVDHHYSLTMSPEKLFLLERNRWETLLANTNWTTRFVISPFLLWTELMMWSYCALRGRSMLVAKKRSYTSIGTRRGIVAKRRSAIRGLRRVSDWRLLNAFSWNYTWDQLVFVGRRRTSAGRRGGRDMPVE
jgi:GT2 family glycosyltransferase